MELQTNVVERQTEETKFFDRFVLLFTNPGKLVTGLLTKPDFLWPLIFILISLIFASVLSEHTQRITLEYYPEYGEVFESQGISVVTVILSMLMIGLSWLLRAGVF